MKHVMLVKVYQWCSHSNSTLSYWRLFLQEAQFSVIMQKLEKIMKKLEISWSVAWNLWIFRQWYEMVNIMICDINFTIRCFMTYKFHYDICQCFLEIWRSLYLNMNRYISYSHHMFIDKRKLCIPNLMNIPKEMCYTAYIRLENMHLRNIQTDKLLLIE